MSQLQQRFQNHVYIENKGGTPQIFSSETNLVWQDLANIRLLRVLKVAQQSGLISVLERSQICDAGPYLENDFVVWLEAVNIFRDLRPGTHDTHVPFEHVDQLRQLINLEFSKNRAYPGYPGIASRGERSTPLGCVRNHGAKFID